MRLPGSTEGLRHRVVTSAWLMAGILPVISSRWMTWTTRPEPDHATLGASRKTYTYPLLNGSEMEQGHFTESTTRR